MNTASNSPENQLPEEVRGVIDYIIDRHVPTPKAERQWLANHLREQITPYLAPRPPAPRDAEALERWKAAREKLATQDTTHDLHYPVAAKVRKQLIAIHDVAIADLSARHAPADSASAQLAAMREERDAAQRMAQMTAKAADNHKAGEAALRESLAAAQSEVGRLTKERDEVMTELSRTLKWARDLQALFRSENTHAIKLAEAGGVLSGELATLRRERDQARQDLEEKCAENDRERAAHLQAYEAAVKERDELNASLLAALNRAEDAENRLNDMEQERDELRAESQTLRSALNKLTSWGMYSPTWASDRDKAEYAKDFMSALANLSPALDSARAKQGEGQG